jgi:metal-responsive CopG/Arc/MetJ family transcriptional regulator
MKVKTSITLSEDLLREIDRLSGEHKNRSDFIEKALLAAVREVGRTRQDARDLDILNRNAEALNREAEDVLNFQTPL